MGLLSHRRWTFKPYLFPYCLLKELTDYDITSWSLLSGLMLLFSCSVVSDSLQPHGPQDTRFPCLSLSPRVCSNSIELVMPSNHLILCCPLLLPSIFPSNRSFPMSWLFASRGQSVGASASEAILPMNIQGWFPVGLTDLNPYSLKCSLAFSASV